MGMETFGTSFVIGMVPRSWERSLEAITETFLSYIHTVTYQTGCIVHIISRKGKKKVKKVKYWPLTDVKGSSYDEREGR